jgi:hypothetical protein
MLEYEREVFDGEGNIALDDTGMPIIKKERYVPEFDIDVKIMDEKPTDRNYYTSTAFQLHAIQGMTIEDVWYTLEEGKFPPMETALANLKQQNMAMQLADLMAQIPPESQQMLMNTLMQMAQQTAPMQGGGVV